MAEGHTEIHYGFFGLTALGAASAFNFNSLKLMDPKNINELMQKQY